MQENKSIQEIYASLTIDGDGWVHLGDDGVVRSYAPDYTVISHARLSPEQISANLARFSPSYEQQLEDYLSGVFKGVDGRTITNETEILDPGDDILPEALKTKVKEARSLADFDEIRPSRLFLRSVRAVLDGDAPATTAVGTLAVKSALFQTCAGHASMTASFKPPEYRWRVCISICNTHEANSQRRFILPPVVLCSRGMSMPSQEKKVHYWK